MNQVSSTIFSISYKAQRLILFQLFKPYYVRTALGLIFLVCANLVLFALPRLINGGVSLIEGNISYLFIFFGISVAEFVSVFQIALAIGFLAVFGAFFHILSRRVLFDVGRMIERDVRQYLFMHVLAQQNDFFVSHPVGKLMSRMTNDISNVRLFFGFALLNILNLAIVFTGTLPLLLGIDSLLGLSALLPFILVMVVAQGLSQQMFNRSRRYQDSLADLTQHLQSYLSAVHILRFFHQNQLEAKRFDASNSELFQASMQLAKIRVVLFPLMRVMSGLGISVVLFLGGWKVLNKQISIGDFVEVNARILQLAWPALTVGFVVSMYQRGIASMQRLNEILQQSPLFFDGHYSAKYIGSLKVENLSYKSFLSNINFEIQKGMSLGLVGASGSGKTLLAEALLRKIELSSGTIKYNDVLLKDWNLSALYRNIAWVSQQTFLFSASIRDNLSFARDAVTQNEIERALYIAGLEQDIQNFQEGLETPIGERGITLSGGQKQRISLARAILSQADFLILDDCLSATDAKTQKHIVQALKDNKVAAMTLIISHRLETLRHTDWILVLEKGAIVEQGTHAQLLQNGQYYARMWSLERMQEQNHE